MSPVASDKREKREREREKERGDKNDVVGIISAGP